ncbi:MULTISPECIES: hypothetical protein [Actinomadura]|uniref:Serine/threonine protein kinase n=1 Tax=Actinomadura yumaensis TaxID=111807 RepID=A0ABW2CHT1_9ACTN|nr:hypothetical protein [Actinomadura sp. J1-007]MWK34909.1 hypothetical protein [Actinomadura sp. J1-007]
MGERSRWAADVHARPDDAPGLARRVLAVLAAAEIVAPERTDCVLGDVPGGYAPGPAVKSAVLDEWTGGGEGWPDVWPNGLEIDVARTAYYGPVREDDRVTCPRCGAWLPFSAALPAVEEWLEGGPADLSCARCARRSGLNAWHWPVPCAFAVLGLRFWNWPPLAGPFVDELSAVLGHPLVTGWSGA